MDPNNLIFYQINLHHCRAAALNLQAVILREGVDIALIQEPWQWKGRVLGLKIPGYTTLSASNSCKIRTCIVLKNNLNFFFLPNLSNADLVVARLESVPSMGSRGLLLVSAYLPYDSLIPPPGDALESLVTYSSSQRLNLVIGADANAHHIGWGSSNINRRGEYLAEYISSTDLVIVNSGNTPTFVNSVRQEVIDITLVSVSLYNYLIDWHVSEEPSFSDHMFITFKLLLNDHLPINPQSSHFRNARHTDWARFESTLNHELSGEVSLSSLSLIESEVTNFNNKIIHAFESCCPLRRIGNNKDPVWWNARLKRLRSLMIKATNRAKNTLSESDLSAAKLARNTYKAELRCSKRDHWRNQCAFISTVPETSRMVKAFSRNPDAVLGSLRKPNGLFTQTKKETMELLMSTHFPGCVLVTDTPVWQATNDSRDDPSDRGDLQVELPDLSFISLEKVKWAINSFSPFKRAGPDNIQPALLQNMGPAATIRLYNILMACASLSYTPTCWRTSLLVFLPKPGKETYTEPKSFRPICLMSFLLKTLERLCDRSIRDSSLVQSPLHKLQHAYMAGRSVESALHCVVSKIESAKSSKDFILGTFLDIEGAFDKIKFDVIKSALIKFRVNPVISCWILGMLHNRCIRFDLGESSLSATVPQGCPQGGVLSPLIWSIVVDSLLVLLNSSGYFTVGYADDIVILIRGKHLITVTEVMQQSFALCENWCRSNGLSVNPNKTGLILFSNIRNYALPLPLSLFGSELTLQLDTKYLGVTLDRKLSFINHITRKCETAVRSLFQCRRAFGGTWGLSPSVTKWIYTAMVRPALCFASIVWWHRVKLKYVTDELRKIQRLACICISGAIRSTATAALEVLLNILPIDIFVESEALASAFRLKNSGMWMPFNNFCGHSLILNKSFISSSDLHFHSDHITRSFQFSLPYDTSIPTLEQWAHGSVDLSGLCVFTDGSKTLNSSGAGIFSEDLDIAQSFSLGDLQCVFQAETFAIIMAVYTLTDRGVNGNDIIILSDSQAVIKALASNVVNSALVLECRQALYTLSNHNYVKILWVPSHSGVLGNSIADGLAKSGAREVFCGPQPLFGLSNKNRKKLIQRNASLAQIDRWRQSSVAAHTKLFINCPSRDFTRSLMDYSRAKLGPFINILTGHCLNRHLHRLGVALSPLCRLCWEEEETVVHILCECLALVPNRLDTFGFECMAPAALSLINVKKIFHFIEEFVLLVPNSIIVT